MQMKFRVGQTVKIIATGEVRAIAWVSVFGGDFYRLDNGNLYIESELELVEVEATAEPDASED